MVQHNFTYPLGHILTAATGRMSVTGAALYCGRQWLGQISCGGDLCQWIAGSAVFVYDYDKFDAARMLERIARYKVTTFCARRQYSVF
jgi:acetyl-CoA synthetase